jgi:hypothetical protein
MPPAPNEKEAVVAAWHTADAMHLKLPDAAAVDVLPLSDTLKKMRDIFGYSCSTTR